MNRPLLALGVVLALAAAAPAAFVATWTFDGTGSSSAPYLVPTTTAAGMIVSPFSGGPNMPLSATVLNGTANVSGIIAPDFPGNNQPPNSVRGNPAPALLLAQNDMTTPGLPTNATPAQRLAVAITQGNYVSVTVAPTAGGLNLDSLDFDLSAFHLGQDNDADMRVWLFSSVGGFGTPAAAVGGIDPFVSGTESPLVNYSLPLGSAFDAVTGPVEFRLYFTSDRGRANNYILLDNVGMRGNLTAVPEPATLTSLGLLVSSGALMLRRWTRTAR